jgi:hypothetical protein
MTKGFIAAAFTGMLTIAIVGSLLYGVAFASFFRENIIAPEVMSDAAGVRVDRLSHVPFGVLLALVVSWRGVLTARGGATTGGLLGFLMAASYNLSQYGTMEHWTLRLTLVEPFITMVMVAIAGAVVAVVLAKAQAPWSIGR